MIKISQEAQLAHNALLSKGLENPILKEYNGIEEKERELLIAKYIYKIMYILNLDTKNDSLKNTPDRISKMYNKEIFLGLDYKNFPKITFIENVIKSSDIIIVRDITLMSTCEHHFITIYGKADIAYIPRKKIIGLSKINRIAQFYSKRPQIQERLTKQIRVVLQTLLGTKDIAIVLNMNHFCVKTRGICDVNSTVITSSLKGLFKTSKSIRDQFLFKNNL
ncbi:GTP cyclohydrolase I FolE [Buchnera aphidicola]|uniref:GTP cyclohydrolase 1 n=1 Tax=Buchnera aphidicola (Aphis gossypii) TaxID=98785 RepID=A0A5J6ZD59_9GAMM|nr:GTP cyclohydrolase I FolE [Buchnera aphidicola]QFQ31983.1 GTP cyclohydrolase I FolE [Buchnera aphidicola (Aphis gossypii)]